MQRELTRRLLPLVVGLAACQGPTATVEQQHAALQVVSRAAGESDAGSRRRAIGTPTMAQFLAAQKQVAPVRAAAPVAALAVDEEDHFQNADECRAFAAEHGINRWLWKNHYSACFVATGTYTFEA